MNIEEEIEKNLVMIEKFGFKKGLILNENQVANIINISPSTLSAWRKQGIGIDYIQVGGRCLYPKISVAEFQTKRKVKTA